MEATDRQTAIKKITELSVEQVVKLLIFMDSMETGGQPQGIPKTDKPGEYLHP